MKSLFIAIMALVMVYTGTISIVKADVSVERARNLVHTMGMDISDFAAEEKDNMDQWFSGMTSLLKNYVSFDKISIFILGKKTWDKLSDEEQGLFINYMAYSLARNYGVSIGYNTETVTSMDVAFDVKRVVDIGKRGLVVSSVISYVRDMDSIPKELEVDIVVNGKNDEEARIVDMIVEGISSVITVRSLLNPIINGNGGIHAFLRSLPPDVRSETEHHTAPTGKIQNALN